MGSVTIYCKVEGCDWTHEPSGIIDAARAVWTHHNECDGDG